MKMGKIGARFAGDMFGSLTFTLIELLVVIAIIAILAGMLLPALAKSMKFSILNSQFSISLAVVLALTACSRKLDVKAETTELEKAFPAVSASAQIQMQPAAPTQTAADANTFVRAALSAVRTNDYAAGVIALQKIPRMPNVTPAQLMAAERAKQAMTAELVARASRGDLKAQADLAAIEKTRSQ